MTLPVKVFERKCEGGGGGRVVVNKKTGAGPSPAGDQGVKPGAGRLPPLIDRNQLLAAGHKTHFKSDLDA